MNVGLLLHHLDIKENNHAGNVINNVVLFLLPAQVRLAHDSFSRLLGILRVEIRQHYLSDVIVREELPDAVGREYYEAIIGAQVELENFYKNSKSE